MERELIQRGGDTWMQNCIHIGTTSIFAARFPGHSGMEWHAHDKPSLALVLRGATSERDGMRAKEYSKGRAWFRAAGESHGNTFGERGALILAFFLGERFEALARALTAVNRCDEPANARSLTIGAQIRNEMASPDACTPIAAEGLMLELATELIRGQADASSSTRPPPCILSVREMLESLPLTETPSVQELADTIGRDPTYVARAFRRHYGMSIGDYVRRRRVRAAGYLLKEGSASLAHIAADCGFFDQSHFCRHFKRHHGLTPGQYRSALCQD